MAGVLVLLGHPAAAVAALWISGFLDAVDGSLARLSGESSAWGAVLDVTFDRLVELSLFLALAWIHPEARWALLVTVASIVVGMTVFLTVGAVTEKKGAKSFYYQAGLGERTEGFLLLTAMVLFQGWLVALAWTFTAMMIVTLVQRLREARRLLR
jgi:phosphatidylglycerophosphate synthase